jgi:tetratricopeptide (TPR) repeat protein
MGVFVEVHAGEGGQLGGFIAEIGQRIYNLIVSRTLLIAFMLSVPVWAQQPAQPAPAAPSSSPQASPQAQPQEQEPPEEDQSFKPKTYDFNPLKATDSIRVGDYYFKKGSFAAAKGRYKDATLYDPGSAEAFEKLGEASEKLHDYATARDSYAKYLEMSPTAKDAEAVKKRMEKLPDPPKSSAKK